MDHQSQDLCPTKNPIIKPNRNHTAGIGNAVKPLSAEALPLTPLRRNPQRKSRQPRSP